MTTDAKEFNDDPRSFAIRLIDDGTVGQEEMLLALLVAMSHDDVRDALDANELSPRFLEEEEEEEDWVPPNGSKMMTAAIRR